MENKSIYEDLLYLQQNFKSKKDNYNGFGKYNYRNIENILTDLKPLLKEIGCVIIFNEELDGQCDYLKVTCTLQRSDGSSMIKNTSIVKIDTQLKGMSQSQMTGSAITYGRKYCLCGLLAIDDGSQDPDSLDNRPQQTYSQDITEKINACSTLSELSTLWDNLPNEQKINARVKAKFTAKKEILKKK